MTALVVSPATSWSWTWEPIPTNCTVAPCAARDVSPQGRWPGADLAVLVVPVVLLVACIQFGFHARMHLYSAADVRDWRPDVFDHLEAALKQQQADDYGKWKRWEHRARMAYNVAIVVLAIGVALVLAPPHPASREAALRWAGSAIAVAGAAAESAWIVATTKHGQELSQKLREWRSRKKRERQERQEENVAAHPVGGTAASAPGRVEK